MPYLGKRWLCCGKSFRGFVWNLEKKQWVLSGRHKFFILKKSITVMLNICYFKYPAFSYFKIYQYAHSSFTFYQYHNFLSSLYCMILQKWMSISGIFSLRYIIFLVILSAQKHLWSERKITIKYLCSQFSKLHLVNFIK